MGGPDIGEQGPGMCDALAQEPRGMVTGGMGPVGGAMVIGGMEWLMGGTLPVAMLPCCMPGGMEAGTGIIGGMEAEPMGPGIGGTVCGGPEAKGIDCGGNMV